MYPTYAPVYDPTAVMGRRFGAWIIDFMIGAVMLFVLFASFAEQRSFPTAADARAYCDAQNEGDEFVCGPSNSDTFSISYEDVGIISIVGLVYWVLNDAVLTGITGFSIGKGIVGLRVVRQSDGRLAGFGRSFARWALWIADWVPFCVPVVGLATANASSGHRRVGDMVAKTLVVDKRQVGTPPQVIGLTTAVPGFSSYPTAPSYPGGGYPGSGYPGGGYPGSPGQPGPAGYPGAPAAPPWAGGPATPPPAPGQPPAWGAPASPPPWGAPQPMPTPSSPPPHTTPPWGAAEGSGPVWAPPPAGPSSASPAAPELPAPAPGSVDPTLVQPTLGDQPPTRQLPAVDPPVATGPGIHHPLWDDARDAYIQWDHDINRWVQWDEGTREWHPL